MKRPALPWNFINHHASKDFLKKEWQLAGKEKTASCPMIDCKSCYTRFSHTGLVFPVLPVIQYPQAQTFSLRRLKPVLEGICRSAGSCPALTQVMEASMVSRTRLNMVMNRPVSCTSMDKNRFKSEIIWAGDPDLLARILNKARAVAISNADASP